MSSNKQSSVEWLYQEFERIDKEFHFGTYEYNYAKNLAFKISKAMHKNEITKAVQKIQLSDKRVDKVLKEYKLDTIAEKYYKETFGGEDEQQ